MRLFHVGTKHRLALWFNYPMTKAAFLMHEAGWWLWAHVLVVGPLVFCVMWKRPAPKEQRREEEPDAVA